ncbi:MAG: hypothetical protein J0I06_08545, partial [Planctomycetes bacterium]|nr:hypothetical protein [Planctomycetota bacterium]
MARLVLSVAAVLGLSELAPARAQFFGGPFYQAGFRSSYSYRSGFGFSFGGPHFRVQGFAGGFVTRSVVFAPPVFAAPFGPVGFGPPVVAVPVPIPVVVAAGANVPAPRNDGPRVPPGDFLVIAPRRDPNPEPLPLPLPRPPAPILLDQRAEPIRVEVPEPDPKKEALRLMTLGRASFTAGDYGRAAEHFERASTADP